MKTEKIIETAVENTFLGIIENDVDFYELENMPKDKIPTIMELIKSLIDFKKSLIENLCHDLSDIWKRQDDLEKRIERLESK
jgi:hypothetical protein